MSRYESEKKWLKSRIRNLEADNEELQRTIQTDAKFSGSAFSDSGSIRKTLSEPELCTNEEEIHQLREENIFLRRELDRVRNSLRHTAMVVSRDRSHMSPAFATLADDLNLVKSDLEQILSSMDHTRSVTIADEGAHTSSSPIHSRSTVDDYEDILKSVMIGWEADEEKHLIWDLKRSRQERDMMKIRIERLTHQLNEARAELEVYRREGVLARTTTLAIHEPHIARCSSASNIADDVTDKDQVRLWKEKCGTMFRELNTIRSGYQRAQEERRELKIQLAMIRGEFELALCQNEQDANKSDVSSVYFSPRSLSCQPSSKIHESRVFVYENPLPFGSGSTHERVVCHIPAAIPHVAQQKRRARSEQRRRTISPRIEQQVKERRRIGRTNLPSPLYSSTTSMADDNSVCRTSMNSKKSHYPQSTTSRRESRVTLLRERVGQLSRENRTLQEQLAAVKAAAENVTKFSMMNPVDIDQFNRLEQEKEALRVKNELLLVKCEQVSIVIPWKNTVKFVLCIQDSSLAKNALADLNQQLELCRNENLMYEKKFRDMEEERKEMYLVMFKKGQEAAAMDIKEIAEVDQMTQDRVVLRFLHDAFYYYLMDKGNAKEHLQAIMTMLDFSVEQKDEITRKKCR
ncbi:hypothetical protein DICVIV_07303 [Dictyocaulus viviparus]|uniref:GRIP domain-containing protein n=1 Tax=Dictyocaulus viviparus TaxID=29172 RepID=A0A0D8XSA7_DICVI|nr:hypothetical protein DICVIV_07303 [Dictyocaulus viviparus]